MKRRFLMLLGLTFTVFATGALAQDYPTKPLTLIVPFAPGGPTDVTGRAAAVGLAKELGQPVVVDNKPGATGVVGLEALERSPPDGSTLYLFAVTTAISHVAQKRVFNLNKQMTPLGNLITSPMLVLVNPKVIDVTDLNGLVTYLRKNPGTPFTSSGVGSPAHLYTEAWAQKLGLQMTHVSYRGIAPALIDVLGGRVGIIFSTATSVKAHIDAGNLRAIAVLSDQRLPFIPDVKTSVEQGFPDFKVLIYTGLATVAGTPEPIVAKLRKAQEKTVQSEDYQKVFNGMDGNPEFIDGPEWGQRIQKAYDDAAKISADLHLNLQ
jgi:tripartite-type tricarboxylate transporter receptor subunit TctC